MSSSFENRASTWRQRALLSDSQQEAISILSQSCGLTYATTSGGKQHGVPETSPYFIASPGHTSSLKEEGVSSATDASVSLPRVNTSAGADDATESLCREVLVSSRHFHTWYERIEAECARGMAAKYEQYAAELAGRLASCEGIMSKIDATVALGDHLLAAQREAAARSRSIAAGCDGLLREKETLTEFAEALRAKLRFFEEFEAVSAQLSAAQQQLLQQQQQQQPQMQLQTVAEGHGAEATPTPSVDDSFLQLLRRLDGCMAHVAAHPQYADAAPYSAKFRQLLGRALSAVRHKVQQQLRAAVQQLQQQTKDEGATAAAPHSEGADASLMQIRFRTMVDRSLRALLSEIERQAGAGRSEYLQVLRECRTLYGQARLSLVSPGVERRVAALASEAAALAAEEANNAEIGRVFDGVLGGSPDEGPGLAESDEGATKRGAAAAAMGTLTTDKQPASAQQQQGASRFSFMWSLLGRKGTSGGGGAGTATGAEAQSPSAAAGAAAAAFGSLSESSLLHFARSCSSCLSQVCQLETLLYTHFFRNQLRDPRDLTGAGFAATVTPPSLKLEQPAPPPDPRLVAEAVAESLAPLLEPLASQLYDTVRPVVVVVQDIEVLCSILGVFRAEVAALATDSQTALLASASTAFKPLLPSPASAQSRGAAAAPAVSDDAALSSRELSYPAGTLACPPPVPVLVAEAAVTPVLLRCIADIQSRLVYRCQACVKDEISGFRCTDADLDFPDRLIKLAARRDAAADAETPPEEADDAAERNALFPPLRASLELLSWLHKALDPNVFSGLALEIVAAGTQAIQAAAKALALRPLSPLAANYTLTKAGLLEPSADASSSSPSSSSPTASAVASVLATVGGGLHAQLFAIKHMLLLREQIAAFNEILSSYSADCTPLSVDLDFSHIRENIRWLLAGKEGLFFADRSAASGKGGDSYSATGHGAMANMWKAAGASGPRVLTYQTDSRRELDRSLKAVCEALIMGFTRTAVEPLLSFITKVTAYRVSLAGSAAGGDGTSGPLKLREQAFAAPSRVTDMIQQVNEALDKRVPAAAAAVQVYLPLVAARRVLLLPVRANIIEAHAQTRALLVAEYGGVAAPAELGLRTQEHVESIMDQMILPSP